MQFARSGDFGRTWSAVALLGVPQVRGSSPAVAGDGVGSWLIAWIDEGGLVRVSHSSDDGVSWQQPVDVGLTATEVAVASAAPDIWLVAAISAVVSPLGTDTLVVVSRSVDSGSTWGSPVEFTRAHNTPTPRPGYQGPDGLALAAGAGTAVLAWAKRYVSGGRVDFGPITAFRSTNAGSWWRPLSLPPLEGLLPTVATNGSGGWAMATNFWRPTDSPPSIPHQIPSMYSTDDGETWQAAETIVEGDVGLYAPGPGLAAVGTDTWVVAMWDRITGGPTGLGFAHRCGAGPSWSPLLDVPDTGWSDFQLVGSEGDGVLLAARSQPLAGVVVQRGDTSAYCTGCDDGDACTIDEGDAEVGCSHTTTRMAPGAWEAAENAKSVCARQRRARVAIKRLRRTAHAALRAETSAKSVPRLVHRAEARTRRAARRVAALRERLSTECATALDAAVAACTTALECAGR
jgi:hypothetical protein